MTTTQSRHAVRGLTVTPQLGDPSEVCRLVSTPTLVRFGHFELLSGLHSDAFVAFSALADSGPLDMIADWLGPTIDSWDADLVLAPSTAGVALASVLARRLSAPLLLASTGRDGRPTGVLGMPIPPAARVLIVNDVSTTGTAVELLARLVEERGATVAGAAWFASRGLQPGAGRFPFARIVDLDLPATSGADCVQCRSTPGTLELALDLN